MRNLWTKYSVENPEVQVSLAVFCRLRPRECSLATFLSRKTCLCSYHQNIALKLAAIFPKLKPSPDAFFAERDDDGIRKCITEQLAGKSEVVFSNWEISADGKKRMKCTTETKQTEDFVPLMMESVPAFRRHLERVSAQFHAVKELKQRLPDGHIVVQMDFAENFTHQAPEEIQSAYWCQTQTSLHPAVAYYMSDGKLQHKSYVFVSAELSHNSSAVFTIMKQLMPELQLLVNNLAVVHYVTDSPTSQYRNKYIFYLIANHQMLFNDIRATWTYWEVGHGKGPCDGIGGTAKRMVDNAIKQEKAIIQDANDFFVWSSESNSAISFKLYTADDVRKSSEEIDAMGQMKAVKGTLQIHAVSSTSPGSIHVRETSCFCSMCLHEGVMMHRCEGWTEHPIGTAVRNSDEDEQLDEQHDELPQGVDEQHSDDIAVLELGHIQVRDFVAAFYGQDWYLGQVQQIDPADCTLQIKFMEHSTRNVGQYRWPVVTDQLWLSINDILCKVEAPKPTGKTKRSKNFALADDDIAKVSLRYQQMTA